MIKRFLLLFSPLFGFFTGITQTSTSDCNGAIALCNNFYSEETSPPGTGNTYEYTGACNANLETQSIWYTFSVQEDGYLSFVLTSNTDLDDYDWGLFDITTGGCEGVTAGGNSPEVSCSSYGLTGVNGATGISTANGGSGNSNGPGNLGTIFNADLPVSQGETFALVVMNWTGSTSGYSIDFGQSTATIYDDVNPQVESAGVNCGNTEFLVNFTEGVMNTSAQEMDFQISGPAGTFSFDGIESGNPGDLMSDHFYLDLDNAITQPGLYTISVVDADGYVEDACGNLAIAASITIELFEPLQFLVNTIPACNGTDGSIEVTGLSGGMSPYDFRLNGQLQQDLLVDNLDGGSYEIEISDQNNCIVTEEIELEDYPISVSVPAEQEVFSCANPTVEVVGATVIPEQEVEYDWLFLQDGDYAETSQNSALPTFTLPGLYELVVTNPVNGCSANVFFELESESVRAIDFSSITFPNIITPNGDSKNDVWSPFLRGAEEYNLFAAFETFDLRIYNRWGKEVFSSEETGTSRWTIKEENTGTYFYTLKYRISCQGGVEGTKEGTIEVIR